MSDHLTVTVTRVRIYPVKSCAGIDLDACQIASAYGGLALDRRMIVVGGDKGTMLTQRSHPIMSQIVPSIDMATGRMTLSLSVAVTSVKPLTLTRNFFIQPADDSFFEKRSMKLYKIWGWPGEGLDMGDIASAWFSEVTGSPVRLLETSCADNAKMGSLGEDVPTRYPAEGLWHYYTMAASLLPSSLRAMASLDRYGRLTRKRSILQRLQTAFFAPMMDCLWSREARSFHGLFPRPSVLSDNTGSPFCLRMVDGGACSFVSEQSLRQAARWFKRNRALAAGDTAAAARAAEEDSDVTDAELEEAMLRFRPNIVVRFDAHVEPFLEDRVAAYAPSTDTNSVDASDHNGQGGSAAPSASSRGGSAATTASPVSDLAATGGSERMDSPFIDAAPSGGGGGGGGGASAAAGSQLHCPLRVSGIPAAPPAVTSPPSSFLAVIYKCISRCKLTKVDPYTGDAASLDVPGILTEHGREFGRGPLLSTDGVFLTTRACASGDVDASSSSSSAGGGGSGYGPWVGVGDRWAVQSFRDLEALKLEREV